MGSRGREIGSRLKRRKAEDVRVEDANSMVDETDPGQLFLLVNILRWREIFRMTSRW